VSDKSPSGCAALAKNGISSRRICSLTDCWVTCIRAAARPRCSYSATAMTYSSRRPCRSAWAVSPGDPTATCGAILTVVDADKPPLRGFFGTAPLDVVTRDYDSRLAAWNEWQPVSVEAFGA
jgi:hypothetical protein